MRYKSQDLAFLGTLVSKEASMWKSKVRVNGLEIHHWCGGDGDLRKVVQTTWATMEPTAAQQGIVWPSSSIPDSVGSVRRTVAVERAFSLRDDFRRPRTTKRPARTTCSGYGAEA